MKQIKIVIELNIFTLDHPFNQEGAHLPRIATVPVSPISLECLIRDEIFWCWLIRCWNETVRISGQSKPFMWGKRPKWKRGKLLWLGLYSITYQLSTWLSFFHYLTDGPVLYCRGWTSFVYIDVIFCHAICEKNRKSLYLFSTFQDLKYINNTDSSHSSTVL